MKLKKMIADCLNDNWDRMQKESWENLERWKNWGGRREGKVILFGAATMCSVCIPHFEKLGIGIEMICDNDNKKHGEFVTGSGKRIKIVSVAEAMDDESEKLCFVTMGIQHFEAISNQLKQYRIAETVMKKDLDFYLKHVIIQSVETGLFMRNIEELFSFYNEEQHMVANAFQEGMASFRQAFLTCSIL